MKHLDVVAAVIENDGEILCVKRGQSRYEYTSFRYEFPGGKIEPGEEARHAVIREVEEELKMKIEVERELITVHHSYPDFTISLTAFLCHSDSRAFTLTEHIDYRWLPAAQLSTLQWPEADKPIMELLQNRGI